MATPVEGVESARKNQRRTDRRIDMMTEKATETMQQRLRLLAMVGEVFVGIK